MLCASAYFPGQWVKIKSEIWSVAGESESGSDKIEILSWKDYTVLVVCSMASDGQGGRGLFQLLVNEEVMVQ